MSNPQLIFHIASICLLIKLAHAHILEEISIPGLKIPQNIGVRVIDIDNINDWLWANLYVGGFYFMKFVLFGGFLQYINPVPQTAYRQQETQKQFICGSVSLVVVILFTTFWLWKGDQYMPYYGYYETHEFGIKQLVMNVIVYMIAFDSWFWFTHVALHHPFLMKYLHSVHHAFVETTAFGQDAVHPLEAVIQGPCGHFLATAFFPMHPVVLSAMGFLTSCYALLAHDGVWDFNQHMKHHFYGDCNFGLYWGFWDFIFGVRYNKQRYPVQYIPTWKRVNHESFIFNKRSK